MARDVTLCLVVTEQSVKLLLGSRAGHILIAIGANDNYIAINFMTHNLNLSLGDTLRFFKLSIHPLKFY